MSSEKKIPQKRISKLRSHHNLNCKLLMPIMTWSYDSSHRREKNKVGFHCVSVLLIRHYISTRQWEQAESKFFSLHRFATCELPSSERKTTNAESLASEDSWTPKSPPATTKLRCVWCIHSCRKNYIKDSAEWHKPPNVEPAKDSKRKISKTQIVP